MGRPRKHIDQNALLRLRGEGKTLKEISHEMGVSIPTLSRRIAYLEHKKGVITKYRALQGLQLTGLQCRIMEKVSEEKISSAKLTDIFNAMLLLAKIQQAIEPKDTKVSGLADHLVMLEMMEKSCLQCKHNPNKIR